jgi:hypothetical protein
MTDKASYLNMGKIKYTKLQLNMLFCINVKLHLLPS